MNALNDNTGLFAERLPDDPQADAFYLVLGSPRGGTTLIAHSLANLGVFMGDKLPFTVEDQLLTVMAEQRDFESIGRKLLARSSLWARHGWKLPQLLFYCDGWEFLPPNTRLILVYRDPVATAVRGHLATEHALENEVHTAMEYHRRMFELFRQSTFPTLFVSYEKALLQPESFISGLTTFIGGASEAEIKRAESMVRPSPDVYQSRDSQKKRDALRGELAGCIDFLETGLVSGWAFRRDQPAKPVEVEFEFESGVRVSVVANRLRADLKRAGRHPSGLCGYKIDFSRHHQLASGELVYARDKASGAEFDGSPFVFSLSPPAIGPVAPAVEVSTES